MSIKSRIKALRQEMRRAGVTAYIIPSTDPHQSEYVPAYWQRRQWISGFTGSVADVVVTLDGACLWTDSRYFLQAEEQLAGTPIKLQKLGVPGVPTLDEWLGDNLTARDVLGADPQLITLAGLEDLRKSIKRSGAKLKLLSRNLVDGIWSDRPPAPAGALQAHPQRFAGESTSSKLAGLRQLMAGQGAAAHVVTRLDCVAWLFNIRGCDVDFTPIAVAYGLVTKESAMLFVEEDKVPEQLARSLAPLIELRPYAALPRELRRLGQAKQRVWVDPSAVTAWIGRALRGADLLHRPCPIAPTKAIKNAREIKGSRAAHERDGVALVRFLYWLEKSVRRGSQKVTELTAAAKLEELRGELDLYRGPSFGTISAYGSHGAIVHYSATPETDRRLRPKGIYLIDAGGQYLDGTTDMTRTVLLGGRATAEQRDQFTRVLKGHIALAETRFPAGVSGQRLDALARRALWGAGLDYGHGTGHGVGSFLGVHESPPGVAPARLLTVALEEGHILSNEPGYYRTGRYGFRIENLVVVVRDKALSRRGQRYLRFETLTRCPIDRRLLDKGLLEGWERKWIDDYHADVARTLLPQLDGPEARWLKAATKPV